MLNKKTIKKIKAREVLDSRGRPTIEVEVYSKNSFAKAMVPSGASTGTHEALELRDSDEKRYFGKGVKKAVSNVNKKIAPKIIGMNPLHQRKIDSLMNKIDGTENKSNLGANAILGVSLAIARLASKENKIPLYKHISNIAIKSGGKIKPKLPVPYMNVLNGGEHAGNKLDIQEFMIVPRGKNYNESLRIGSEVYQTLKKIISQKYGKDATSVGDEGGFAPNISSTEEALNLLQRAVKKSGYEKKVKFAIDAAASEFYNSNTKKYTLDGKKITSEKLKERYEKLIKKYPIISIEDPFDQEDFDSFGELLKSSKNYKNKPQIVGDDLLVTNTERIQEAIEKNSCNALLLKVNQIGSLTEAIDAALLAIKNGWSVMVSHRSGETEDPFIADLSVGLGCGQIKSGAPCRSERLSKYNQLLRIEEKLAVLK